jgi:hypothetical protein
MREQRGDNSRKASPLDFFRKSTEYVDKPTEESRYSICTECQFFKASTRQCIKCGCFMHLKTKIAHAECPIGKWQAVSIN